MTLKGRMICNEQVHTNGEAPSAPVFVCVCPRVPLPSCVSCVTCTKCFVKTFWDRLSLFLEHGMFGKVLILEELGSRYLFFTVQSPLEKGSGRGSS